VNPLLKQIDELKEELPEGRYVYVNPLTLKHFKVKTGNYRGLIIVKDMNVPPEQVFLYKEKLTIKHQVKPNADSN